MGRSRRGGRRGGKPGDRHSGGRGGVGSRAVERGGCRREATAVWRQCGERCGGLAAGGWRRDVVMRLRSVAAGARRRVFGGGAMEHALQRICDRGGRSSDAARGRHPGVERAAHGPLRPAEAAALRRLPGLRAAAAHLREGGAAGGVRGPGARRRLRGASFEDPRASA